MQARPSCLASINSRPRNKPPPWRNSSGPSSSRMSSWQASISASTELPQSSARRLKRQALPVPRSADLCRRLARRWRSWLDKSSKSTPVFLSAVNTAGETRPAMCMPLVPAWQARSRHQRVLPAPRWPVTMKSRPSPEGAKSVKNSLAEGMGEPVVFTDDHPNVFA